MQVQDDKPYDDINITPMLDLAYVLLVIFILMCTATAQGLKANLPRSGAPSKTQQKNKLQVILVNPDNSYLLNGQPVTLDQLQMQLSAAKSANPQLQVVLKGESASKYEAVIQVLNVLGELNIRQVAMATKATASK